MANVAKQMADLLSVERTTASLSQHSPPAPRSPKNSTGYLAAECRPLYAPIPDKMRLPDVLMASFASAYVAS